MTARPAFGLGFSLAFALGFNAGSDPLFPDTQEHDGISYDASLDADNGGRVVVRAPGQAAVSGSLTSLFTFTRASTATFRGRDGLLKTASSGAPRVEAIGGTYATAPHNLLAQSENLTIGATWVNAWGGSVQITPDQDFDVDGALTADLVRSLGGGSAVAQAVNVVLGRTYVFSAYVRFRLNGTPTTAASLQIRDGSGGGALQLATTGDLPVSATLARRSFTWTSDRTGTVFFGAVVANVNTDGIFVSKAQAEESSVLRTYVRTQAAAIAPVWVYENYRLGLRLENSRTNLALQSEDLSTSHATVGLNAVQTNVIAAPTGAVTADRISEDTGVTQHRIRQTTDVTIASGDSVAFSYFVKADQKTRVSLRITESTFASDVAAQFNLATGVLVGTSQLGVGSNQAGGIEFWGDGWYRIWVSGKINGGFLAARCLLELNDGTGSNTYTGDGTSGLYAFGEQIEAAAEFPSSYIATTTGSVLRQADLATRTLGSEFSATAGSAFFHGTMSPGRDAVFAQSGYSFDDGTTNERICTPRVAGSDSVAHRVVDGGVLQATNDFAVANSAAYRGAQAWAANDFAASVNGAAVLADAAGSLPTMTTLQLGGIAGGSQANGHIFRFDYYPSRLSNDVLQAMTA